MSTIERILVPVDFSPCSDLALRCALAFADACGAEVEVLHVWSGGARATSNAIFAETPEGEAMERWLSSAAERACRARVSGRLEFGDDASGVILGILERETFDLVVMGREGDGHDVSDRPVVGHVASSVTHGARCAVVTLPGPLG